ncbi:MAG: sugar phosphate isomerase/epimerase family protein [Candidatus Edwardsbacteria bacterium]
MELKFSAGLWVFGGAVDRFCPKGYSDLLSVEEIIEKAGRVHGLKGVECHQTDFDTITTKKFTELLKNAGLTCSNINLNVWGASKWKLGAFSSLNKNLRKEAISEGKRAVDIAREIGCPSIGLWLGSDGFDYPFQVDYRSQWDSLLSAIREVAEYASPDIKVGIEYKLKEPRTHIAIGTVGKALAIVLELNMDNLGVTIDFGHSLMAKENPGESVAILARHKKLFNIHFNDCYREWDDDMIPGVIHFWETLEFLYYCRLIEYDGWFALDMYPYREDPVESAQMAIDNIKAMWKICDKIDVEKLVNAQKSMDAIKTQKIIRSVIF